MKLLTNIRRRLPRLRGLAAFALLAFGVDSLCAQAVAPVTPEDLAKYDKNKNGVLDAGELAAKQAPAWHGGNQKTSGLDS